MINRVRSDSNRTGSIQVDVVDESEFLSHGVEPKARTALLPPVMVWLFNLRLEEWCILTFVILQSKKIDEHPLSGLAFEQDCIITSCLEGMYNPTIRLGCCYCRWARICTLKLTVTQDMYALGIDLQKHPVAARSTCRTSLGRN